jgi:hypothetical protein
MPLGGDPATEHGVDLTGEGIEVWGGLALLAVAGLLGPARPPAPRFGPTRHGGRPPPLPAPAPQRRARCPGMASRRGSADEVGHRLPGAGRPPQSRRVWWPACRVGDRRGRPHGARSESPVRRAWPGGRDVHRASASRSAIRRTCFHLAASASSSAEAPAGTRVPRTTEDETRRPVLAACKLVSQQPSVRGSCSPAVPTAISSRARASAARRGGLRRPAPR